MAVTGTSCQICSMPVQQDHYIPYQGMFQIYRGGPMEDGEPIFPFGPEHEWLKDAVALRLSPDQEPQVMEGEIHDGWMEGEDGGGGVMVWDGVDDRAALHKTCWKLAGKPEWASIENIPPDPETADYMQQLFEFDRLQEDGKAWMLADPARQTPDSTRNRERILKRIGPMTPRSPEPPKPPEVVPLGSAKRRFERKKEGEHKFWEITFSAKSFTIRYGDVGGEERLPFSRECETPAEARRAVEELIASRLEDGFVEV